MILTGISHWGGVERCLFLKMFMFYIQVINIVGIVYFRMNFDQSKHVIGREFASRGRYAVYGIF